MSEEEKKAIIHLIDKKARYEYAKDNDLSFSDEDYEAYIIRQSMINKDYEIEQLKSQLQQKENIIKEVREYIENHIRIDDEYPDYMEMLLEEYNELLEILDKVGDNNE